MTNATNQMAAMSVAMRMLLANHPLTKPTNLLIAACDGVAESTLDMMMRHGLEGRATFLAIFEVAEDIAFLAKVMIVDGATTKGEINVCNCQFVQKTNGSFAIRSMNRDQPYEYSFTRGGRRLQRRAVKDDSDRGIMEIRGLQALLAKAATPACRAEAFTATTSDQQFSAPIR